MVEKTIFAMVEVLYGFLVDPGPYPSIIGCFKSSLEFTFMLKNTLLEIWDVVEHASCGTCVLDDDGEMLLSLILLNADMSKVFEDTKRHTPSTSISTIIPNPGRFDGVLKLPIR